MAHLEEGEVGLVASITGDFAAWRTMHAVPHGSQLRQVLDVLTWPGFIAVVLFRVARAAHRAGLVPLARIISYLNFVLHSFEMSPRAVVGPGFVVPHPQGAGCGGPVRIGKNVRMLRGVALGSAGYDDPSKDGLPVIGDDVLLSDSASIWGPVTVGSRSTIGAGVTLFKSVPEDSVVMVKQPLLILKRGDGRRPGPAPARVPVAAPAPAPAPAEGDGAPQLQPEVG